MYKRIPEASFNYKIHESDIKNIDIQLPTKNEILAQTWDKEFYYTQWSGEVDKIDCVTKIDVSECELVIYRFGRDGLQDLVDQFLDMLEYGIDLMITIQNKANENIEILGESIQNGPEDSNCIKQVKGNAN